MCNHISPDEIISAISICCDKANEHVERQKMTFLLAFTVIVLLIIGIDFIVIALPQVKEALSTASAAVILVAEAAFIYFCWKIGRGWIDENLYAIRACMEYGAFANINTFESPEEIKAVTNFFQAINSGSQSYILNAIEQLRTEVPHLLEQSPIDWMIKVLVD